MEQIKAPVSADTGDAAEGEKPTENQPPAEEPKPEEPKEETPQAKADRVNSYQALKTEVETFRAEREQTEKDLAAVGGREGLSYISNLLGAFSAPGEKFTVTETDAAGNPVEREVTGKDLIYEFVNNTPEADGIFSDFFIRGLENEQNRVFAVNDVLKQEFALRDDVNLSTEQINSVFEYLAAKLNTAKTPEEIKQVFDEFDFQAKGLDYDREEFSAKQENERLKAEIEKLRNPETAKKQEDPVQKIVNDYQTALDEEKTRVNKEDELMIARYTAASTEFFGTYGLAVADTDTDDIKAAKTLLNDIILGKQNVAQSVRFSPAFKSAAGYLHKGTLQSHLGNIAGNNLDSAMRAQVSMFLKKLSPILGAKAAATQPKQPKPGADETINGNRANIQPQGAQAGEKKDFRSKAEGYLDRKIKDY